jgi:tRNA 5-methylaminomethyl-2-thiouridine biosynthesis bifunctional protein
MPLAVPVAGDGYALPLPEGGLLCGATREAGAPGDDPAPRLADHRINLDRLQRLTGLAPPGDLACLQGRVGWRLQSDDRLPIAGAVPLALARMAPGQRLDQARLLPREAGLFVLTALGARGLTLAPLLGRLVAAQATGTPWPLEQDLADAVDPARWVVRAARAGSSGPAGGTDESQAG